MSVELFLDGSFAVICALIPAGLWRVLAGPTVLDRLMAGELTAVLLTFLFALVGARAGSELYLDAALVLALLAFISTVAIARFLAGRRGAGDG